MIKSQELFIVKVSELNNFIDSPLFHQLTIKSISKKRALSQSKNPFADSNDIALIFAVRDNQLIGFVGFIPYLFTSNIKAYYNSGWWINPSFSGKNLGVKLFKYALEKCNYPIFFTDSPDYTRKILSKTGNFTYLPANKGKKLIIRTYLPKKRINNRLGRGVITFSSKILNSIIDIKLNSQVAKLTLEKEISYKIVESISESDDQFIKRHTQKSYLVQSADKLNWIKNNPWLSGDENLKNTNYPFSLYVKNFFQELIVIKKNEKTLGIILLNYRDGMATIPYYFCDKNAINIITKVILQRCIKLNINNIVIYDNLLQKHLLQYKSLYLYKKNVVRHAGFSNNLAVKLPTNHYFCDGDGDTAFT